MQCFNTKIGLAKLSPFISYDGQLILIGSSYCTFPVSQVICTFLSPQRLFSCSNCKVKVIVNILQQNFLYHQSCHIIYSSYIPHTYIHAHMYIASSYNLTLLYNTAMHQLNSIKICRTRLDRTCFNNAWYVCALYSHMCMCISNIADYQQW